MVKFKVHVYTPYEDFDREYFARTSSRAISTVDKWNTDFKGTEYSVELINIEPTIEKVPDYYTIW